jgi:acyl transferase domain-containing protein/acyl carrier protein
MTQKYDGLEIAIIGMSGQFPGSGDHRRYWDNLRNGRELLTTFTDEELLESGVDESALRDPSYIRTIGVMEGKDHFDNSFFEYSPEEAALMDPQLRLYHEHCWKALEDAGYTALIPRQKIGMFAGASRNDTWKVYVHGKMENAAVDPFYLGMISSPNFISTLVSYKLNLRGPSFYVDTACSTSLAAVHLACRNLLTRESSIALAGGVSVPSAKRKGQYHQEGMIFSTDGRCRAFDAESTGTAAGEGVGVVVLKRLADAMKDRDNIYAIIRATAANNDGNSKVGYTAPGVKGQAECIKMAHKIAGIDPRTISYVEAHGTGTKLGDPVEVRGLNEAFGTGGEEKFCAIGSVKTNIGHLDVAAGVAGLIKTALALKHREIPASLHFKKPNPEVDFAGGPFYVNTDLKEWKRTGNTPLRAGVSSLGIGGTNVHAVLEEAPQLEESDAGRRYKLLTLSARTKSSLSRYTSSLKEFLQEEPSTNLADMSYTLQAGRKHFGFRRSLVYESREDLLRQLEAGEGQVSSARDRSGSTVFMFSGAGSQYEGMGRGLYETEPLFREQMDQGFARLKEMTGIDYCEIFYPASPGEAQINRMLHTQPAIFLFGYSLARLLMSWGVSPRYMVGHSIGEYVAACLAGVFTFEDALKLVVRRGQLMDSLPPGGMLSVPVSEVEAGRFTNSEISLAAINSPDQVVFSGEAAAMDALARKLDAMDITSVRLYASQAGHSHMIDGIMEEYRKDLEAVAMKAPAIPFISNLTGNFITAEEASSADYWLRHMRHTVQFSGGLKTLVSQPGEKLFIEIGGGHSLSSLLSRQDMRLKELSINLIRHPKEEEDDNRYMTERLGKLWALGLDLDWSIYYANEKRRRVSLPAYSFEQTSFPAEVNPFEDSFFADPASKSTSGQSLKDWVYYPVWKCAVAPAETAAGTKRYLFFSTGNSFASSLKDALLQKGHEVVEVTAGDEYRQLSAHSYTADPAGKFTSLFERLQEEGFEFTDIIYSWGMNANPATLQLEEGNREFGMAFFSLVKIAQALLQSDRLSGKKITVLTHLLHKAIGHEQVSYGQSLLLGLVKVIPHESEASCINIDIDVNEQGALNKLVEEIESSAGKDRVVALRYGRRWIQDYQRHGAPLPEQSTLEPGGVYLVTGGLGNIGFTLSKHLIQKYGAKVALTGRSGVDAESNSGRKLKELQGLGEANYYTADVCDRAALEETVHKVEESMGRISGVIHAAGTMHVDVLELVEDMSFANTSAVLSPKIKGIQNLYEIFREKKPGFVWLVSTAAAELGGLGLGQYAAAHLYMDHFIYAKTRELPGWRSVRLAELLFTEEEIKKETEMNRQALKPSEITELFEWSLTLKDAPVILETVRDLQERIGRSNLPVQETVATTGEEEGEKAARPGLATPYVAPETDTEKKLAQMVGGLFGVDGIGVEDNFFELGGDSLKAMVLIRRIKKEFDISIPLKEFFGSSTIRQVAAGIDEKLWISQSSQKKFVSII